MANVFANKDVFKEAFQTRVEQIYGVKFEESIFHQIGLRQMRQLQRGNTNKSIISQWNF